MNKIDIYQELITKMLSSDLFNKLESNIVAKGNIAYLVDTYSESTMWENITKKINNALDKKDRNELCWLIYKFNYDKYMENIELDLDNKDAKIQGKIKNILKVDIDIMKKTYAKGKLRQFTIVDIISIPGWFYSLP